MQTIFAQATARGKAGVAIVRISGPDSFEIGQRLVGDVPDPGRSGLRSVRAGDGEILDRGLVLFFRGPASFTGEDVLELQLHGSVAVVRAVETAITETGLARVADAGEFTQRALLNDTLDLTQVEGLGSLIDAETEAQRVLSQRVFAGALTEKSETWRALVLRAAALLEASIDFVDEDVPVDVAPEVLLLLDALSEELQAEIKGSNVAERVREGFEVAILGAPNAGKSTLVNALAGRDIAITSEVAGTTRDVIEARLDVGGLPVTFLDTAGLRDTDDRVESIGVDRAIQRALAADLRIVLLTDDWEAPPELIERLDYQFVAKADQEVEGGISGQTGAGISEFLQTVSQDLGARVATVQTAITARQGDGIRRAVQSLETARSILVSSGELELAAEHIRSALWALDSILGRVDVEAVLGEIFSRFCIGK
jgi:tRNA modification GTPase